MTFLARLLGLLLPACGAVGAQGLPVPPPLDIAHLTRPGSPNTALAAPAGFLPAPDIVTPTYRVSASRLYAAIQAVAAAQPRAFPAAAYADRLQAHWVVRSAVFNFPDEVTAQASPAQASPAQPSAVQATPAQATPAQAAPDQAAPGQAAPGQGISAQAAPAQATSAQGISAQGISEGTDTATLVLYSRSVYGYGDLGANRQRVAAWLAALDHMLDSANER
jgi:uncharacterized protein (DUF1499 family)